MTKLQIWLLAIRPKTLPSSLAPILIGTAMAYSDGGFHFPSALAALIGALLIQIGTNLANDYFDCQKGADHEKRTGPLRVTQSGLIPPKTVWLAFIFVFTCAAVISLYLIKRGGWPILFIGIVSILSGIFYTAGRRPLGYLGLGDIFVFVFFGPVAVGGTYYVQTLNISWMPIVAGFAPGFLSTAVLSVNNLRDMESDRHVDKKTLAVRFGRSFALSEYFICIAGACAIPVILCALTNDYSHSLAASLILFLALPSIKAVFTKLDGPSLNQALADTGKLLLLYSVLFSIGWIL